MTLAFWDGSAFVELLIDEAGNDDAERLWNDPAPSGGEPTRPATALGPEIPGVVVATWDRRLSSAAVAEGLHVVPGDF